MRGRDIAERGEGPLSGPHKPVGALADASAITSEASVTTPRSARRRARRRMGLGFWLATGFAVVVLFFAVTAEWLPFLADPVNERFPSEARRGPSGSHWFGVDQNGRDVFARTVHGARTSLTVGVVAIFFGGLVGGVLGLIAGFRRGWMEGVIVAVIDTMLAFPALVLALALVAFFGQSLFWVTFALAVLSVPALARIVRASTLAVAQREFVLAARAMGARNRRIVLREILPVVTPPMMSFALLAIAVVIVAEGALSFLGLGVPAPRPTWGGMINQGRAVLQDAPHVSLMPALVMFMTILSFNFIGERLQERFNVRESLL